MIGKCAELLINLPGQSAGNIGEVVDFDGLMIALEMIDGKQILVARNDVKIL